MTKKLCYFSHFREGIDRSFVFSFYAADMHGLFGYFLAFVGTQFYILFVFFYNPTLGSFSRELFHTCTNPFFHLFSCGVSLLQIDFVTFQSEL